jgi:hypothetical protein
MKWKLLGLTAYIILLGGSAAGATPYEYDVNLTLGSDPVFGSILTDCNNCTLAQSDIVGWSLSYTVPYSGGNGGVTTLSLDDQPGQFFYVVGNGLTATPSGMYFNFDSIDLSLGQLYGNPSNPIGSQLSFYDDFSNIPGSSDLPGFYLLGTAPAGGDPQPQLYFAESGNFLLATSATPLPAAFPLFATGLGALGLLGWRRKLKKAAWLGSSFSRGR